MKSLIFCFQLVTLLGCILTASNAYAYYDPSGGRWLSRDPVGEAGGLNLYGFVRNDPINNVDALGEKTLQFSFGFDGTFKSENTSSLERYKKNLEVYVKKCIKLASPTKPLLGFIGRAKPAKCPDIDLQTLQALGVDVSSAGHFPCIKPADGKHWSNGSDNDPSGVSGGVEEIKKKNSGATAVLLTKATIYGGALGRSSVNSNSYFVISDPIANDMTFPHEFGHRIGWQDTGSKTNGPYHSDDDDNLMNTDAGPNVDCQFCRLLLQFAR